MAVLTAIPQVPQWLLSFSGFTQVEPHNISGAVHIGTQVPDLHVVPGWH